ncbi:disease resistance protein RPV1 isoform X1 [Eucalyptus grandis]|uniref:disease resistance protein RPV1 isoform X1 n=1 Tax=Eucalyptus grandis TaxID=71139 RepID=UPI00192EE17E|nr:disease resistance protein RPV1 isoform X1 [Eucalyptus grandis]XP_039167905.1 disease resistance protein RPV1 isoform X1 [Eucalyptus grandis]
MKRKWDGEEMAAPTGNIRDDRSGRGYEVFLSFRGLDTRLTIADCLYEAMIHAGIRTFKDDPELRIGKEIGGNLLRAINNSRIYIPIFSKNYASSKWCLRELAHMVECIRRRSRDEDEKVILPIFFDVDADDVKIKTELYRKALQKHESDFGKDLAKQWEEALREVASIKGWNLKDHGLHKLTNLMVQEVYSLLWTRRTDTHDCLVGIEDRKDEITKLLDQGTQDVQYIVIHGMGGIGKTSLAEVVFKQISPQFQGHCCFLKDVRTHDILNLQKKLLSDILNLNCTNLSDINEGANVIKRRFHEMEVLIVLDDIDKLNQIEKLAGEPMWFGGGSRIIITTRNIEFLVTEGEDDNVPTSRFGKISFYEMPEMDPDDALQLFCEHALGCAKPSPDYLGISCELIHALGRLPLALEVIGSTLRGKCKSTWEDVLQQLKTVMNQDVKKKLMISYEELNPIQRKIYLDIACLFINQEKTTAIIYWDAVFKYPTEIEVKILTRMSLIKIVDNDKLWMHDQLRDLGRDIVHPESCKNHLSGSRLWSPKDAFHVMQRKKGTKNIVALNLGTPEPDAWYIFKRKEFARLENLRFLQLDHGNFKGEFKDLFSELRWLSWSNCPSEVRDTNFGLKNLVVLELSGVNITEDWGGWCQIMVAKQLKVLKLVDCTSLRKTLKFSTISRLERLILIGCTTLSMIDETIGNLQHLDHLEIEEALIESLPESIGGLKSMSKLSIRKCCYFEKLPDSIGQLESLLELHIHCSRIRELPHSIGCLEGLKVLCIMTSRLEKLPTSIGRLQSLHQLDVSSSRIMKLPHCIGNLKKLKEIYMDNTCISELPKTIGMVENLEKLTAAVCDHLEGEIPSEIGALSSLRILDLSCGHFSRLPTTINQLTNLQELRLLHCNWIQQLPELPQSLTVLHFSMESLTTIPDLSNLTNLVDLDMCGTLVQEPNIEWLVELRALRKLALVVLDMTLPPTNLSSLSQLQELEIGCTGQRSLTGLPSNLRCLTLANVQSLIDWSLFSNLENLSELKLHEYQLGEIQFDVLGKLTKLSALTMRECPLLKTLPVMPFFKDIRNLNLNRLPQLTGIQGLEELKSLQCLSICWCNSIKRLAETALSNLQNLNILKFVACKLLESVPDVPYAKSSCHLIIKQCPRLCDFEGPYRSYKDG